MGFFGKSKENDKINKRRAEILGDLKTAIDTGATERIYAAAFSLSYEKGMLQTPDMPYILTGAVEALARRNLDDALNLSIYAINIMRDDDVQAALSERALQLIGRTDRGNMKQMAGVAMLAGLVMERAPLDSDIEKRALKAWHNAADALASKKEGLGYAFAAASNAALSSAGKDRLKDDALDFWEKTVAATMKTDFNAAKEEAKRVAGQYADFGYDGHVFRKRARDMLAKMPS